MRKNEFYLQSPSDKIKLHCICWEPDGECVAVVQIVHGMIEYADRYGGTAEYLCRRGFAVVSHDHPGHGLTAKDDEELGYIPRKGGSALLVDSVYTLTKFIKSRFPGIPNFILGHSMGSFITRRYLTKYGSEVSGAVIVGTGDQPRITLWAARLTASLISFFKGDRYRSRLLTRLAFGNYNKRFDPDEGPSAWICSDRELIRQHDRDKYSTFTFTAAAYGVLFDTLTYLAKGKNFDKIPKNLPIFVMAGMDDPVGRYGRAPEAFAVRCREAGINDVDIRLYEGDRHEILNEKDKDRVLEDLFVWLKAHLH